MNNIDDKLNNISKELYDLVSTQFPDLALGDEEASVVTDPEYARFFDFTYVANGNKLGKVSLSLDDESVSVMYQKDFIKDKDESTKESWYNFLRKIRRVASINRLTFDVRDINKSNLNKRDYQVMSNEKFKETKMAESKFYGTNHRSYLKIGEARLVIRHSQPVNLESITGRTQHIDSIYIESAAGERFKYPFKHLNGAKAMARHVSEGGNQYDDFGTHIVGLSEELAKLGKFKRYMGRGGVMAESLSGYVDAVNERVQEVKKRVEKLQRESFYKEEIASFETTVLETVPDDVSENWIDQLTIKQFNEELKDVFPYIYRIVSEKTRAQVLGPDELVAESNDIVEGSGMTPGRDFDLAGTKDHNGYTLGVVDGSGDGHSEYWWSVYKNLGDGTYEEIMPVKDPAYNGKHSITRFSKKIPFEAFVWTVDNIISKTPEDTQIESGFDEMMGQFSDRPVDEGMRDKLKVLAIVGLAGLGGNAALDSISAKNSPLGQAIAVAARSGDTQAAEYLKNLDSYIDGNDTRTLSALRQKYMPEKIKHSPGFGEGEEAETDCGCDDSTTECSCDDDGEEDPASMMQPEKPRASLGEFILSFYDSNTGNFPKGETSVLTMVEKEYGDQYVHPATEFIKQVHGIYEKHTQGGNTELDRIKSLAGM